ncbi:MAG: prepilin-type N-terminal cleavage/methylation domain-containing protein [Pseudomonadota bacterium]
MRIKQKTQLGFSLIELMIVVGLIGVLSAIALPAYQNYIEKARLAEAAAELIAMADRVRLYEQKFGRYPNDNHQAPPPDIDMPDYWDQTTPFGGSWNWEGPNRYPYAGISVFEHNASDNTLLLFDQIMDDGDMDSGLFRWGTNNPPRPVYIIEDNI